LTATIFQLRYGQCACIIPERDAEGNVLYCALPVSRNFRMCEAHGAAYLVPQVYKPKGKKNDKSKVQS